MSEEQLPAVARDGTQRGLNRRGKKNRRTELIEACQAAVERDTGISNWDPVVMLAVISARAFNGYPATDEDGNPVIDEETGKQVMVPPDYVLASAVAAKAAPYLHQHLRPKEVSDSDDAQQSLEDKHDAMLARLEAMGVPVDRIAKERMPK